jgi:hypothetical protein
LGEILGEWEWIVGADDDQSMGRRSESELIPSSEMVELACEGGLLEKMKIWRFMVVWCFT